MKQRGLSLEDLAMLSLAARDARPFLVAHPSYVGALRRFRVEYVRVEALQDAERKARGTRAKKLKFRLELLP